MARIIQTSSIVDPLRDLASQDDRDWVYNGLDCCVTLEVLHKIEPLLDNVTRSQYEFSKSLMAPVLDMTMRGLLVDLSRRDEVLKLYRDQINEISWQLDQLIAEGIGVRGLNWRSPLQLKRLFYDVMGLKEVKKRNSQGKFAATVNREAIEKLSEHFYAGPICSRLLALRDIDKKRMFLETGIDADNRIRTNFNIAGTNTTRLASSLSDYGTGTNLQNVDRELRYVFVADPGMKFANIDLEQADARNIGAWCWNLFVESHGEAYAGAYLDACESGDLHTTVCSMAWRDLPWTGDRKLDRAIADGIGYRTYSYRDLAKKLGHGTNYYGTPPTMAKHTKVNREAIELFQNKYFGAFPAIGGKSEHNYHKWVKMQLLTSQEIVTPYGLRRLFFGDPQADETLREAIAFGGQSMTAKQINIGKLNIWRANICQLMVQVHDSILVQYPEDREDEIVPQLLELIKAPLELAKGRRFVVPSDCKTGWNWGDVSESNPEGLMKYKGGDTRKRIVRPTIASLFKK